jgi:hypothetical protein
MSEALPKERSIPRLFRGVLPGLCVSVGLFAWLLWVNRSGQVFEFDPDEGNNVIKALLVREGFSYGTEIWTDQPPLFTYLLLPAFAVFGLSMDAARGVVSAMSALLAFGVYEALRRRVGHLGSLTAVLLLVSSALYIPLSLSVMIGLPCVACLTLSSMLSLEAAERGGRDRAAGLAALGSGVLAGAAVGIKLFSIPVVPVLLATVMISSRKRSEQPLLDAGVRGAAFSAGFATMLLLALGPLALAGTLSGLVETHQVAREQAGGDSDGLKALLGFVREDRVLFGLAAVGTAVALLRRSFDALPWLGWLLVAGAVLLDHSPVWPHHRLLLTVPAAALAGHAFRLELPARVPPALVRTFRIALPLLAALSLAFGLTSKGRLEAMVRPKPWTNSEADWEVFHEFARYAEKSSLVAAARPTFAFRAGRPVPPNLAVTSWKRFRVGLLRTKRVADDIARAKPETILLSSRWPGSVRAAVEKKIKKTHRRVKRWRNQSTDLWVSQELLDSLPPAHPAHSAPDHEPRDRPPRGEAESHRRDDSAP